METLIRATWIVAHISVCLSVLAVLVLIINDSRRYEPNEEENI